MNRLIYHIHTKYSFDSLTSPESIIDFAVDNDIDTIIITDHDSVKGSLAAKRYAERKGLKIKIPIAAEFFTDIGDIIAVNISEEFVPIRNHKELYKKVKEKGGFLILPHPYYHHNLRNVDFSIFEFIEVFNSRCSEEENLKAEGLATKHSIKKIYGSDAHLLVEIGNVISEIVYSEDNKNFTIKNVLNKFYTSDYLKMKSQCIKALKTKSLVLLIYTMLRFFKKILIS
jgi:predicted metal-dependent phosphoesterase TrpH